MIPVGIQDGQSFLKLKPCTKGVFSGQRRPVRQLCLDVDSFPVGRIKSGFGWCPLMKTVVVDAIAFGLAKQPLPCLRVHRRVTGKRENAAVVLSS